jgi:phosphotransferase system HPr-like phosphotransfer protein
MAMKAKQDTVLFARARGADAMSAIAALVSLIERAFVEDPAHAASG